MNEQLFNPEQFHGFHRDRPMPTPRPRDRDPRPQYDYEVEKPAGMDTTDVHEIMPENRQVTIKARDRATREEVGTLALSDSPPEDYSHEPDDKYYSYSDPHDPAINRTKDLSGSNEIDFVEVYGARNKGRGVATAMLHHAIRLGLNPRHSSVLSEQGMAWAKSNPERPGAVEEGRNKAIHHIAPPLQPDLFGGVEHQQ